MKKAASSKLLFLLSVLTRDHHNWLDVNATKLPRLPGYPKRDKTTRKAISALLESKKLDFKKDGEKILIKPSAKGYQEISLTYPYYRQVLENWDGKFRLVIYDIPEISRKYRDAIRRILKLMHFGRWHNSFWITPYNLADILDNKLKEANIKVKLQHNEIKLFNRDLREFSNNIWGVDKLNDAYHKLYDSVSQIIRKPAGKRRMEIVFRDSFLEYQRLIALDPGIPLALLPKSWYGEKVREGLRRLQKLI